MPAHRRKADESSQQEDPLANLSRDPFVRSEFVMGLTHAEFRPYLKSKHVALVMFYSPTEKQCEWSRKHFKKASKNTNRQNHGYAAVDCSKQQDLCTLEGVTTVPYYKLYSGIKPVGFFSEPRKFLYEDMKKYMETVPAIRFH